jgi:hypothetical protein
LCDSLTIGNTAGFTQAPSATIDEVRVALTARGCCFIETEHENIRNAATFFTLGPEE